MMPNKNRLSGAFNQIHKLMKDAQKRNVKMKVRANYTKNE